MHPKHFTRPGPRYTRKRWPYMSLKEWCTHTGWDAGTVLRHMGIF